MDFSLVHFSTIAHFFVCRCFHFVLLLCGIIEVSWCAGYVCIQVSPILTFFASYISLAPRLPFRSWCHAIFKSDPLYTCTMNTYSIFIQHCSLMFDREVDVNKHDQNECEMNGLVSRAECIFFVVLVVFFFLFRLHFLCVCLSRFLFFFCRLFFVTI